MSGTEAIQTLLDALSTGAVYALAGTGIALIYGVMRLMNFAHGEVILAGAYILLLVSGAPWAVVIVASLGAAIAVALAIERLAYRPVRNASPETLLVTSFAVAACIQNIVILIAGSRPQTVSVFPSLSTNIDVGGVTVQWIDVVTFAVTVLVLALLRLFLSRSLFGVQLRGASENFRMARLLGVRANRTIAVAFAISGILAGTVALLMAARTGSLFPTLGLNLIIFGFVATIIGGLGNVSGAIAGGFVLGATQILLQKYLPVDLRAYRDAFLFAGVIAVLLLRPAGLFPSRYEAQRV